MKYVLTHYGHAWLLNLARRDGVDRGREDPDTRVLLRLFALGALDEGVTDRWPELVTRGMVKPATDDVDIDAVQLAYDRNPLEHVRRVVFEYTTLCNLDCKHCRNTSIDAQAEARPTGLRRLVDVVLPLGVDRFDFIGGEVTLYGKGWLELVRYIRSVGGTHVTVITSGWFLGETDFWAAGRRYADDAAYLADLAESGVTHVVFSLDGPRAVHDDVRRTPGLYDRVLQGIEKVRAAGLAPRVSLVVGVPTAGSAAEAARWVGEIGRLVYGAELHPEVAGKRVVADESNYVSRFIDVGAGVTLRRSKADLSALTDEQLRCKNFFRPSPTLRVKATGEISLCPLVESGDGYGNVHDTDALELLNRLHEAFVYKLHAERQIGRYRGYVDAEVFGGAIGHACSVRAAINMVGRAIHEGRVDPTDAAALRALNVEVAQKMGVLPRPDAHRANGQTRPR